VSAVENPVRAWLRLEAFVVFAGAVLVWIALDGGWASFALMFFLPDLSFAAYLLGSRVGSMVYNLTHSYAIPAVLAITGAALDQASVILAGSLWTAHIGFDRALGFGLKYPTGFSDTHLGQIGRARSRSARPTNAS
jgi:Domain of unknown function (DUF4260)